MVHGGPDFGIYHPRTTVISVEDLGELAVRLGSIVNFDRKGDVVWFDGFEDGIDKWYVQLTGGRGSFTWDAAHSRNGNFSGLITTGTTLDDLVRIYRYLPTPVFSKLGFEFSFTSHANILNLTLMFQVSDGTDEYDAGVRYVRADNKWQYWDKDGEWQDLSPTISLYKDVDYFHTVKLVFDLATQYYSHLIVNDTSYNLASYEVRKRDTLLSTTCFFHIAVKNNIAAAALSRIDDVIITQNEP